MTPGSDSRNPQSEARPDEQTAVPPWNARATGVEEIDQYRLLELVGEGGMGEVYKAEQRGAIRRLVALKLIRLGLDTKTVIARFDAERQALALMNHANIAKVYDGGTTKQGRPYFVMEFVAGEPITTYCDRRRLPIRARLELFAQVCDAVQHAHTKGIIHRDLKASNVLVAEHDGKPSPKVIDFGVAKALNQRLTEQTLFTETGRLVGTPAYSSPEQAEGGVDVDTRSDVYSLGVMLYELLTGALPFDPTKLRELAYGEMQRMIREVDPPRPSTFYSTPSEASREAAQKRAATVDALASALRHELEWIPLRAMRKERSERYQTAAELAADIANYLKGLPLIAGPDSRMYRLRKAIRRHRGAVAAAAGIALALLIGAGAATWQWRRALVAEGEAQQRAVDLEGALREVEEKQKEAEASLVIAEDRYKRADAWGRLINTMFAGLTPEVARNYDKELLKLILAPVPDRLKQLLPEPGWRAGHLHFVGDVYRRLGEYELAGKLLQEGVTLDREAYAQALAGDDLLLNDRVLSLAMGLDRLGSWLTDLNRGAQTVECYQELLALQQRHFP